MRLVVMFDLPSGTSKQKKNYRHFRKNLIKQGFIMMQESVYCKLCLNGSAVESMQAYLENIKPPQGLVQVITMTEKQFSKIKFLVGEDNSEYINSSERILIF